jgi:hypothetical protein
MTGAVTRARCDVAPMVVEKRSGNWLMVASQNDNAVPSLNLTKFITANDPLYFPRVHRRGPVAHMRDHMAIVADQQVSDIVRCSEVLKLERGAGVPRSHIRL